MPDDLSRLRARRCASSLSRKRGRISPSPVYGRRCPKSLPPNALVGGADEGARAKRRAAFDVCFWWVSGKSSSLRSRPHPALRATFSRCAGEGLVFRRCGERRSEEHTSELQSLMRISYAVFCLKKKNNIA